MKFGFGVDGSCCLLSRKVSVYFDVGVKEFGQHTNTSGNLYVRGSAGILGLVTGTIH